MNADELRKKMQLLPEPPNSSSPPHWDFWRRDLYDRIVGGQDPEGLFGFPCVYHCMRVNHWMGAVEEEYQFLVQHAPHFIDACIMPEFGYPKDYFREKYSAALIHQAFHLCHWSEYSGLDVSKIDKIFEFGGGYGAMALVVRRLGFAGKYSILDLPEFCLLQEYYLSNVDIGGVEWMRMVGRPQKHDLFIACFSLSESSLEIREFVLDNITADNYLFLYNKKWVDYDNMDYFGRIVPEMYPHLDWLIQRADPLPEDIFYTIGREHDECITLISE